MNARDVCLDLAVDSTSRIERIALLLLARSIEVADNRSNIAVAMFNAVMSTVGGTTIYRVVAPANASPDPHTVN